MFKDFAETVGKVHTQLMEGAITYEEFFNKTVHEASQVLSSQRYREYVERNPDGDPMGKDPENQ